MKFLPNVLTSAVGRQILVAQKNSPTLMLVGGAAGFVATVVLASKATLKMDGILREAEEDRAKIEKAEAEHPEKYTAEDAAQDRKLSKVKLAVEVAKAWGPTVVVGVGTLGLFVGAHMVLTKRVAGLTAAYAAVDKAFKEYRQRVIADVGEEKEREYRYDIIEKEIAVEDETGVHPEIKKVIGPKGMSMYAVCFDRQNRNWKPDWQYNRMFLAAQQTWANNKLKADGHIFLNDVRRMIGLPDVPEGQVVGWVDGGNGDDTVVFDIYGPDHIGGELFAEGNERSVWIDFNVDGVVYDMI